MNSLKCSINTELKLVQVRREKKWRFGYGRHIVNNVRKCLESPENAFKIAKVFNLSFSSLSLSLSSKQRKEYFFLIIYWNFRMDWKLLKTLLNSFKMERQHLSQKLWIMGFFFDFLSYFTKNDFILCEVKINNNKLN